MSIDINVTTQSGRLTKDSVLRYTPSGVPCLTFSYAVNYSYKSGESWIEKASFFMARMYGKRAESLSTYLTKGQQVLLQLEVKQDRWEKNGPQSRIIFDVVSMKLIGSKSKKSENSNSDYTSTVSDENFEDDIPF